MRFFNKESNIKRSDFNIRVYPDLKICSWVEVDNLPKDEQTKSAKQMGGVLKTLTYKEAWIEYWNRASEDDKKWYQELPNFSAELFEEITGINVEAKEEMIEIDGRKWSKSTLKEALKKHSDYQ